LSDVDGSDHDHARRRIEWLIEELGRLIRGDARIESERLLHMRTLGVRVALPALKQTLFPRIEVGRQHHSSFGCDVIQDFL
jgi:hypothetical protein